MGQLEGGVYLGHFAAGAHGLGGGAFAQQQPHGVDNDRLARPRLAGEDVQPWAERQMKLIDDRKIANAQFGEHSTGILPQPSITALKSFYLHAAFPVL